MYVHTKDGTGVCVCVCVCVPMSVVAGRFGEGGGVPFDGNAAAAAAAVVVRMGGGDGNVASIHAAVPVGVVDVETDAVAADQGGTSLAGPKWAGLRSGVGETP